MINAKLFKPNIFASVTGVVFLGTPHQGTGSITSKGLLYAAIASHPSLRVTGAVLEILEHGNRYLMDILNEFVTLCNNTTISLFCFFEQRSTHVGRVINNRHLEVRDDYKTIHDELLDC